MPNMLREASEYVKRELRLPEIIGERCVHALVENATCDRCVQVCPRDAWVLDDEMLGINADQCDGCGLCAAVCPQGALIHEHQPLPRYWKGLQIAFGACEPAGVDALEGVIPCLHAFSLQDLLQLHRQGYTDLVTTSGDCDDCPRGRAPHLENLVEHVNQLLSSRELPAMRLQAVAPRQWQLLLTKTSSEMPGPALNRRGFLTRAVKKGVAEAATLAGLADSHQHAFVPPGELLTGEAAEQVMPHVPVMDVERCDGCDACANLCPHEAINLIDNEEAKYHYQIEPSQCSGCGICGDVCERNAISVDHWAPAQQTSVSLRKSRCKRCGAPYHMPDHYQGDIDLCHICARVNHYQNLYQVLE